MHVATCSGTQHLGLVGQEKGRWGVGEDPGKMAEVKVRDEAGFGPGGDQETVHLA